MEFEEIAKKAYKEEELDKYSNLPEKYAYLQLKELYYKYKIGELSKEKSIVQKNAIKKEFNDNIFEYNRDLEQYKIYNENRNKNTMLLIEIEKAETKEAIVEPALKIIANCVQDDWLVRRILDKF